MQALLSHLSHKGNNDKMLEDPKTMSENNLITCVDMLTARLRRLEGKRIDHVLLQDASTSGSASTASQSQYGMLIFFYDMQGVYEALIISNWPLCQTVMASLWGS